MIRKIENISLIYDKRTNGIEDILKQFVKYYNQFKDRLNIKPKIVIKLVYSRKQFDKELRKRTKNYWAVDNIDKNTFVCFAPGAIEKYSPHKKQDFFSFIQIGMWYVFLENLKVDKWIIKSLKEIDISNGFGYVKFNDCYIKKKIGTKSNISKLNYLILKEGQHKIFEFLKSKKSFKEFFGYEKKDFETSWDSYISRKITKLLNDKLKVTFNPKVDKDFSDLSNDILKAYNTNVDFYGKILPIHIFIADSRDDLEILAGKSYEKWFVGSAMSKKEIVVLSQNIIYKEEYHKSHSRLKLLIHEMSHIFINNLFGKNLPVWVMEGLCEVVSNNVRLIREKKLHIIDCYNEKNWEKYNHPYQMAASFLDFILKKYGKKALFKLLRKTGKFNDYNLFFEEYKKINRVTLSSDCKNWLNN